MDERSTRVARHLRSAGLLAGCLWLSGCGNTPPAPVEDRSRPAVSSAQSHHYGAALRPGKPYTVRRGDTLYAIAFRLGMDHKVLAKRNAIEAPYTIFPGQVLATDIRAVKRPATKSESKPIPAPVRSKTETRSEVSRGTKTSPPKPPAAPTKSQTRPKANLQAALGPVSRWHWPSAGRVSRGYSESLHKGIDIAGKRGSPVQAVAAGTVVYAGTGVTGYGALIIVKHNDDYLSAYGHNDALLVAEGDSVSARQTIAKMGSTGTDTVKLHFEIRRRGKPIDPLKLLPKR